ncbi:MAG TPA: hypothetical protein DE314_07335 [Sulfitobacter sp.]|nr:hypothetical protein [Sulfitobacter sp.]
MSNVSDLLIQIPGWALFLYLAVAQCPAAISYKLGIRMGTQEPPEIVTEVGAALFWGFAVADLVFYVPLLGLGLVGHLLGADWFPLVLGAALGITLRLNS